MYQAAHEADKGIIAFSPLAQNGFYANLYNSQFAG